MQSIAETLSGLTKINTPLTSDVIKKYQCEECGLFITVTSNVVKEYHCSVCGSHIQVLRAIILGQEKNIDRCKTCEDNLLANETREMIERKKKEKLVQVFEQDSLINKDLRNKGFKDYKPVHPLQKKALEISKDYAKNFSLDSPRNLLFQGEYGLGKSHLAVAISKNLIYLGYSCIFVTTPKLLTKLKATFNKKSEITEDQILTALENVDCLVLDDIGAESIRKDDQGESWALDKFFEIIDSRQGRHTIYTTNLNSVELVRKYSPRNYSRMMKDTEVIKFDGEDGRTKGA